MKQFQEIQYHYKILNELWRNYWLNHVVFSLQWWILIIIFIIPIFIWWKFVDKNRIYEISVVGLVAASLSYVMDQIGTSLDLWNYPYTLTPLEREVWDPADFSVIPFFFMMIYQYIPSWKMYLLSMAIFAFVASFVGGGLFEMMGNYEMTGWKHIYSVPIYILLGIFIKGLMQMFQRAQSRQQQE